MIKNGDKVRILKQGCSLLGVGDIGVVNSCTEDRFRVKVVGKENKANWFNESEVELLPITEHKQLINTAHQLYKELELWQGMLENAEMILALAKKGKEFSTDDVTSAFKQVKEIKTNCNRVQESIDKVINEIKAL